MKKRGRPTKYSQKIADLIFDGLSEGIPLAVICRPSDMPNRSTVYDWMEADEKFSQRIARARSLGYDAIADECLIISDNTLMGEEVTQKADGTVEVRRGDMLGHRKLQVDARLKLLAKWDPKRYGDKQEINHTGNALHSLQVEIVPPKEEDE